MKNNFFKRFANENQHINKSVNCIRQMVKLKKQQIFRASKGRRRTNKVLKSPRKAVRFKRHWVVTNEVYKKVFWQLCRKGSQTRSVKNKRVNRLCKGGNRNKPTQSCRCKRTRLKCLYTIGNVNNLLQDEIRKSVYLRKVQPTSTPIHHTFAVFV